MLPSNENCNNNELVVSYPDDDQSMFHRPFTNESIEIITTNFKEDDDPLSIFHFPPSSSSSSSSFNHYYHHHDLELEDHNFFLKQIYYDRLLLQHQESVAPAPDDHDIIISTTVPQTVIDMVVVDSMSNRSTESNNNNDDGFAAAAAAAVECNNNKRCSSSKTDRHSKINTLNGLRNRRMRLSLEVAPTFFHLQDMLGYDTGSKTVEWLLIQAKPEINKLEKSLPAGVNYCGAVVGAKTTSDDEGKVEAAIRGNKHSVKEKKIKHSRKTKRRPLAKDLREKARARAKERTCNKKKKLFDHESKLAKMKEPGTTHTPNNNNKNHSLEQLAEFDQERIRSSNNEQPVNLLWNQDDEEFVYDALVTMEKLTPFSASNNYLQTFEIPQEHHQFAGFQYFGKP